MTRFWGIFFLSSVSESNHYKINPQKPVLIHDKALFIGLFSFLQIYICFALFCYNRYKFVPLLYLERIFKPNSIFLGFLVVTFIQL